MLSLPASREETRLQLFTWLPNPWEPTRIYLMGGIVTCKLNCHVAVVYSLCTDTPHPPPPLLLPLKVRGWFGHRVQMVQVAVYSRVVSYVDYSDLESSVVAMEGYRTIKNSNRKLKASNVMRSIQINFRHLQRIQVAG